MKQIGVVVPVVTPCSKDGQPDLDGVKSVCKYFIDTGCHGIFVLGRHLMNCYLSRSLWE